MHLSGLSKKVKAMTLSMLGQQVLFSGISPSDAPSDIPLKSEVNDFLGRFREIVSDPINLLIDRHPLSGCLDNGLVILHNGVRVPYSGKLAYYGRFSEILIINRGVHEPLEEYIFQQVLKKLPPKPTMIELGAYWGHYSMWCKKVHPEAHLILVEPSIDNIASAKNNFRVNKLDGEFIQSYVGRDSLHIDDLLRDRNITELSLLHCDIQGFEVEMLEGAESTLSQNIPDYIFLSTHSESLHLASLAFLRKKNYRIEVDCDFDSESTSSDGFILATSSRTAPVFANFPLMGRIAISKSTSKDRVKYLESVLASTV